MNKFLIFAGTTEGRTLAEYLVKRDVEVHICVASEYGASILERHPLLFIHEGRKSCEEMIELMKSHSFCEVIDATHPYAIEVSKNVKKASITTGLSYTRLKRQTISDTSSIYVDNMEDALLYLRDTTGNIFVTTGSKELEILTGLPDFKERVYARVLFTPDVVKQCSSLGLEGKHLMCMQGPFDTDMNMAMMKHVQASYLLTKESGETGGFDSKMDAARQMGVTSIVIAKPKEDSGYTMHQLLHQLYQTYTLPIKREIAFVGLGVGASEYITPIGKATIEKADLLIGAKRMIESVGKHRSHVFTSYKPEEIQAYVEKHPEYENIVFLLSGDVGFYSATKRYQNLFPNEHIQMIPGISSLVYFCSKLHMSWDNVDVVSMHGRKENLIAHIKEHEKVFVLLGTTFTAKDLCTMLNQYGYADIDVWIGENLSYPNENIQKGTPSTLLEKSFNSLSVAMISHTQSTPNIVTSGWADEVFERSKVPMTKSEVRSICLSKLQLTRNGVVYDVGSGSGSIAVEVAAVVTQGEVYAIEHKAEAIKLIEKNRQKFKMEHLRIIEGMAPDSLSNLPAPTHAFIGGSNGNMKSIIQTILSKNPLCRIVISAITLETISEIMQILPQLAIQNIDIVQVHIARSKTLGSYHMMTALNPVFIVSFTGAIGVTHEAA